MPRTTAKSKATVASYVEAVRYLRVKELEECVKASGTEFLKDPKAMDIKEIDVSVLAYYGYHANIICMEKVLELDPSASLKQALHYSIEGGAVEAARLVLDAHKARGENVETVLSQNFLGGVRLITESAGRTLALLKEVCEHAVGVGDYILKQPVTMGAYSRLSPIQTAATGEVIDYLCTRWKQDPNDGIPESDCDRSRPIHSACARTKYEVIDALIRNGAHLQARTVNGTVVAGKPFHVLCANTRMPPDDLLRSLRLLVAKGADATELSIMEQRTPLAIALKSKNNLAVAFLIVEARVPCTAETDKFRSDAVTMELLSKAQSMQDAGLTTVEVQPDPPASSKKVKKLGERQSFSGEGVICSERCVLSLETYELACDDEPGDALPKFKLMAEQLARCLIGEPLGSDASHDWQPFWCRQTGSRARRRGASIHKARSRILAALGSDAKAEKTFTLLSVAGKPSLLAETLGWDDSTVPVPITDSIEAISVAQAAKLDRGQRLFLILRCLGKNAICARFQRALAHPVFIGAYDDDEDVVYGCFATRVDT